MKQCSLMKYKMLYLDEIIDIIFYYKIQITLFFLIIITNLKIIYLT